MDNHLRKQHKEKRDMKKRLTGIGGLFFKSEDPKASKDWYQKHLGFNIDDYGSTLWWKDKKGNDCSTQWSPFTKKPIILNLLKKTLCLTIELKI